MFSGVRITASLASFRSLLKMMFSLLLSQNQRTGSLQTGLTNLYVITLYLLTRWQKLDGAISRARCHPRFPGVFAFGGKDLDLEIWQPATTGDSEFQTLHPSWIAKNVKNDQYNLKHPVWISDLHFLDDQRRPRDSGFMIVVSTRFHQVSGPWQ
jgi:hypothetical protein